MNETTQMGKEIRIYTLILTLLAAGISMLLFQGQFSHIGVGIFIGALAGLIGFNMIIRLSNTIEYYGDTHKKGHSSYVMRYLIYTIIFAIAVYKGVHVIALLAGMLCHKASILLYVIVHRKEDD